MRKSLISFALVLFVSFSATAANAASLAGVTLPDSQQVAGKNLVLNGLGLRSKMMVKVYVAGLYLEQKSSDPNAINEIRHAQAYRHAPGKPRPSPQHRVRSGSCMTRSACQRQRLVVARNR